MDVLPPSECSDEQENSRSSSLPSEAQAKPAPLPTKRHLALIGFMGAGKTTTARLLSQRYGRPSCDLDETLEAQEGRRIGEIFAASGERYFREREHELLRATLQQEQTTVIACGGGVVTLPANMPLLKERAVVVYLHVETDRALARIDDFVSRPLLAAAASTEAVFRLAQSRIALYEAAADFSVGTNKRSPDEVVDTLVERLKGAGYGALLA